LANPCKTDSTDTCEYGELIDDRDGQTYKTVKIGDQVWMAENLNYAYLQPTEELDSSSFCYNDSAEYCEKYGRLYTWVAAEMACPEGWHLPTETEWKNLFTAVGGSSTAGSKLKSAFGWNDYKDKSGNGTDAFGFSALPAGSAECVISVRDGYDDEFVCGAYGHEGYSAFFWIFTEENSYSMGLFMQLSYLDDDAGLYYRSKKDYNYRYSVRCLQD
jgi:uncharacterized protein (TIGR02145 family)